MLPLISNEPPLKELSVNGAGLWPWSGEGGAGGLGAINTLGGPLSHTQVTSARMRVGQQSTFVHGVCRIGFNSITRKV